MDEEKFLEWKIYESWEKICRNLLGKFVKIFIEDLNRFVSFEC